MIKLWLSGMSCLTVYNERAIEMKIVFIVPSMQFGGAERVISILTDRLTERGHKVYIGIFNEAKPPVVYTINEKASVDYISPSRYNGIKKIKEASAALERYLREIAPDVVVSFCNIIASRTSMVCKKLGIPMVFSERNDPSKYLVGIKSKIYQKILTHNVKDMVFQTAGARAMYPKNIQKRSVIILNPLNVDKMPERFVGERRKEIVSVGRLDPQKRHDVMIRAFHKIADSYPEYNLTIYGEGARREPLTALINELGLEKRVFLPGTEKNIFDKIKDAYMFVFTSDFEGLPNALIEAMALGLPCISTKCSPGGAEELVNHGENGLLVECGDVDRFALEMEQLLLDKDKCESLGKRALEIKKRVLVDEIITQWEKYLENVTKNARKES